MLRLLPNCYLALTFALVVGETVCYNKLMPATTLEEKTGMLRAVHILRRPVVVIWFLALFTAAVSLVNLAPSPLAPLPLIGASIVVLLLILGDLASVELEDGSALTPVAALLIAGLVVAGWPLLLPAALVGTLGSAAIRRRTPEQALTDAGR